MYIKGKVRHIIYEADSGYKVGIMKLKETDDKEVEEYLNKSINFVGYFADLNKDYNYVMNGSLVFNEKYGYQYKVDSYTKEEIKGKDALIEFLESPLIKGVGKKTAKDIVEYLGDDALNIIKESYTNLFVIPKMTETKAQKIYKSITKYSETDDIIVELKKYGFTINESLQIINRYGSYSLDIITTNPYPLKDIIEFNKIDKIYTSIDNYDEDIRNKYCVLEIFSYLEMDLGSTYFNLEEIKDGLKNIFNIILSSKKLISIINILIDEKEIIDEKDKYFLYKTYDDEVYISDKIKKINDYPSREVKLFDTEIIKIQERLDVTYNEEQLSAIKKALENRVTIITGGPGTGKTTIINAITNIYIELNKIDPYDVPVKIALVAPTGRAAKKLSESTKLPASTIHRYLKWNKEANDFGVNEFNPNKQKLIIVDETSMIDNNLFASLLRGITTNVQLVLVGDANQLPSVGPGTILDDLIKSNLFAFQPLHQIYRQSNNSYIPILASEIKNKSLSKEFTEIHDDYNFLTCKSDNIKEMISKICKKSLDKGLNEKDIQVLIPMYKGVNGIDNINILLQSIYNKEKKNINEIKYYNVIFRENDKVIQLVNNPDKNVFNGDIGYIKSIITIEHPRKETIITIDFDGIKVEYKKEELNQIKHAYAMTIHKAQGSEFKHVIMVVSKNYYKMLYNKLIYTGVSRAKKSLVIIGEQEAMLMAVNNNYAEQRNTNLLNDLLNII